MLEYGLSVEDVASKLSYDPDTGIFVWIVPVSRNVCAGSVAGCEKATRSDKGGNKVSYRYIRIGGASIPAAKLAWALHYGEWPRSRICFTDGNTLNLRIANLYEANEVSAIKGKPEGYNRNYLKAHREAHPKEWKDSHLSQKYGIDLKTYIAMAIAQNNRCAICNQEETQMRGGKVKSLAVDHDHKTGKIRGLLCFDCNTAIGKLKDDYEVILSAAKYLRKHSENSSDVVSSEAA